MPTLLIDHMDAEQAARLYAADDCTDAQWSAVRRLCEERSGDARNDGPRSIVVPWWSLLSFRDALRLVLSLNGIDRVQPSATARAVLVSAQAHEQEFRNAPQAAPLSPEEIVSRLHTVGFERCLMPYQLRNVSRLSALPAGATFSVPGAGKTTEALALYFLHRQDTPRLLVIAPKNAFTAWEEELPICVPTTDLAFLRLTGGAVRIRQLLATDPGAVIVSYHQLPRIMSALSQFLIRSPSFVCVDESHRMKRGSDGVHGACVLQLAHLARRKLIMSGTPMPNSRADLVPQFSFLYPEIPASDVSIVQLLQPIYVRTTKRELGLDDPLRVLDRVDMLPAQRLLYNALLSDAARRLAGLSVSDRLQFRAFAKCVQHMLQTASNPALLAASNLSGHPLLQAALAEGVSPKIAEACRLARKLVREGNKVLVWSCFVLTVEHVAGLLADLGAEFIHGGVDTSDDEELSDSREAKIRRFKDAESNCRVLVGNPAACGEGISLHRTCHHAIYVDRNYNAAQYLQSEDRIHRIGLAPGTRTYITLLHSPNTIDESVNRRLDAKVAAMRSVLNDPGLDIQPIDLDDDTDGLDSGDLEDIRRMLLGQ